MGCTTLLLPMGHALYNAVRPMGHGVHISHGAWVVQCFPELSISHDPWAVQHFCCPWVMRCTTLYGPWVMGYTFPMGHGLYGTFLSYQSPTTHGPYNTFVICASWVVQCFCRPSFLHDSWDVQYCTTYDLQVAFCSHKLQVVTNPDSHVL
jgi:hypothetical protein